jgi:hypothetical protein
LAMGCLTISSRDAVLLSGLSSIWAGVASIDIAQLNSVAGDLLHSFGQRSDLCSVPLIGGDGCDTSQPFARAEAP